MLFGETLRKLRTERKITQAKLAQVAGVDRTTVNKWESVNAIPHGEILKVLADYFNVSLDYLLGRTDNPQIAENPLDGITIPKTLNNVQFAFHNGLEGLTQEDIDDVVRFIEFIKSKKK